MPKTRMNLTFARDKPRNTPKQRVVVLTRCPLCGAECERYRGAELCNRIVWLRGPAGLLRGFCGGTLVELEVVRTDYVEPTWRR